MPKVKKRGQEAILDAVYGGFGASAGVFAEEYWGAHFSDNFFLKFFSQKMPRTPTLGSRGESKRADFGVALRQQIWDQPASFQSDPRNQAARERRFLGHGSLL